MKSKSLLEVFSEVYELYKKNKMEILGCYFSKLNITNIGNQIIKKNKILSTSGGICNDEATIVYMLSQKFKPKNILIIGNSYGFSSVFMSVCCPKSKLVAFDKYRTNGIKVTKKILKNYKKKIIIQGSTPEDLNEIITKYLNKKFDMVLVDGVHTNEVQSKEFDILIKYATKNSIVVFHDVLECNLLDSFNKLKKKYSKYGKFIILNKTTTGIGLFIKTKKINKTINNFLNYFSTDEKKLFEYKIYNEINANNDTINSYFKKNKLKISHPKHPQK